MRARSGIGTPIQLTELPHAAAGDRLSVAFVLFWFDFSTNLNSPCAGHPLVARTDYAMCGGDHWTYRRLAAPGAEPVCRAVARIV